MTREEAARWLAQELCYTDDRMKAFEAMFLALTAPTREAERPPCDVIGPANHSPHVQPLTVATRNLKVVTLPTREELALLLRNCKPLGSVVTYEEQADAVLAFIGRSK